MGFVRRVFAYPLFLAILAVAAFLIPALAGAGGEPISNVGDWQDEEFPNLMLHPDSVVYSDTPAGLPADVGEWQLPISWPADAVHMMSLYTGQVLFFRGDEVSPTSYTWDPVTNQILSQSAPKIIWCGGNSFLPDGRVLQTGGSQTPAGSLGPKTIQIFDPQTSLWTRMADMRRGRYYPTNLVLGDGRTLIFAGTDDNGGTNDLVEAYVVGGGPGGTDLIDLLAGATKAFSYYPRMHLLPSGEVALVGPDATLRVLDPLAQTWRNGDGNIYGSRTHGTSVALPPGFERIMILGGHNRGLPDPLATNTTEIINMAAATPTWVSGPSMRYKRMHLNTAILPDGKVLVAGGTSDEDITPVYPAEMFDPQTNTWTEMAPLRTRRGYHSSMVLLPDGRVVMAGSNGNPTAEVYSPPYLFRGTRPTIDNWPLFVQYGQSFTITTSSAPNISSVVFMRPGASTHTINMEQRYVPLTFSQSGPTTLNVTSPVEPNTAPPGYYMMFIVNANGVPSVARWVQIGGTILGNRRPSVDAGPTQAIILPAVASLDGTVTDDNLPDPPAALTTTWSVLSGPGPVIFGNEHAVDTTATFSIIGDYILRLEVDDGALVAADAVIISVSDTSSPAASIERRVNAASDDAEEAVASRVVNLDGAGDLEMVDDDGVIQLVGMRFNLLDIPRGAPIQNAWIQFRADEITSVFTSLTLQAQNVDNAPTFAAVLGNISSRARTSASVNWQPAPWLIQDEIGPGQRTPNLKTLIQEVVNRAGWNPGNSLAIIVTGSGKRVVDSYEGWPVIAPLLHVDIGSSAPPPPAVNHEPTVNAGPDRTIMLNQSAALDATVGDDGLPAPPGAVTTLWVKESGPGIVTFANPNAIDTTAQFSVIGRYELQIIANDGEFVVNDTMAVNVNEVVNVAPTVNAGPDRTITINQSAALDGTVTDDGLPSPPGMVTTLWEMASGPGTVTFANPNAVDTTAQFSVIGIYQLRLTANDGALGQNDTMNVTVNDVVNVAPTVNAGPDRTIALGQPAVLDGTVTDDGIPSPPGTVTTLWEKVSGPGTVTFANPNAVDTTAQFSVTGSYQLRLTANDGALAGNDTMAVTVVNQAPSVNAGPDRWIALNQSAVLDGTVSDDGIPSPPGTVTALWEKVSGPGTVTFANPNAVDTTAQFSVIGSYQLRLTANDSAIAVNDTMAVTVYDIPTGTLDRRISAGNGDSEQRANGKITLNSTDLELVTDGSIQTVGLRFSTMNIPQGATILRAYVQFRAHSVRTGATSLRIEGQAADNAAVFTTTNLNVSSRARTTSFVQWNPAAWNVTGEIGVAQQTPDLSPVIQQIVNRTGWINGNALALIITGTGVRTATSYEGGPAVAPLLHVEWK